MKATFKPTNFVFQFDDRYFIQAQYDEKSADGSDVCKVKGCVESYSDALDLAQAVSKQFGVKATHIFTRHEQIKTIYRERIAA